MTNDKGDAKLVRTSVLVSEETDRALREIADKAHRPLSWEIRLALEAHVQRELGVAGSEAA
jgi:predicted transcriptional regulator